MPTATVLGAGVSGLVSALALVERGWRVDIVAAAFGDETTSSVAGAIWLPYLCEPHDDAVRWASATYTWLHEHSSCSETGVDMLRLEETADEPPWWLDGLPAGVQVDRRDRQWCVDVPRVDPTVCLPWLRRELERRGVGFSKRRIERMEDLEGDRVINCTGLGAAALCGDASLFASFGQVVLAEPGDWPTSSAMADETGEITYVIPRRECVVLGGVSQPHPIDEPAQVREALTIAILERAAQAGVSHGAVLGAAAALRPCRTSIRLEREGRVVHNYGHGGAGWTLCWGCAKEVVELVG